MHRPQLSPARKLFAVSGVLALIAVAAAAGLWAQEERAAATGEPQMSVSIKSPLGHCDDQQQPTKCDLPLGQQFQVGIEASVPPSGGYTGFQTLLTLGDLIYKPTMFASEEIVWPGGLLTSRVSPGGQSIKHVALSGPGPEPLPVSDYVGNLVELTVTCPTAPGSHQLDLLTEGGVGASWYDFQGSLIQLKPAGQDPNVAASLVVNCLALPTFTPTHTPTGPSPTPTRTSTPISTPSGAPGMALLISQGGQPVCDAKVQAKCTVGLGSSFTLSVVVNPLPAGGYAAWQTEIDYGGLVYNIAPLASDEIKWDLGIVPLRSAQDGLVIHADLSSVGVAPLPVSFQKTPLLNLDFECAQDGQPPGASFSQAIELINIIDDPSGSALYDAGGERIVLNLASLEVNCVPLPPAVRKSPALSNLFLTAQGDKLAPDTCLSGSDGVTFTQAIGTKVSGLDKHGDPRDLGGFSFKVNFDETKVCVQLVPGPLAKAWVAAGGACIIYDAKTNPTLQGSATIACNSLGKGDVSPPVDDNLTLAEVIVRPMPDEYSVMRPNNGNGNVVQIINKACKLTDRQGDPIAPPADEPTCTDADITIRYLEGDVVPDCVIDTVDTQAEAFRWGSQKGALLYSDFFNTEPSKPKQDDDIDINDLQFVYGRFGSTCEGPYQQPEQPPVNPKAT